MREDGIEDRTVEDLRTNLRRERLSTGETGHRNRSDPTPGPRDQGLKKEVVKGRNGRETRTLLLEDPRLGSNPKSTMTHIGDKKKKYLKGGSTKGRSPYPYLPPPFSVFPIKVSLL